MNSAALSSLSTSSPLQRISSFIPNSNSNSGFTPSLFNPLKISPKLQLLKQHRLVSLRASNSQTVSHGSDSSLTNPVDSSFVDDPNVQHGDNKLRFEIRKAVVPPFVSSWTERFTLGDRVSFLLAFIACTTSVAFTSLVVAAVPTLFAMRRTAISLAKLADTAREELPSTMAAVRLSSMEISDLTLELSDLSQEITEGISKSAQVVQAAEDGIKQIGTLAHKQTVSMIEERANLPVISWQPVVSGAAKKTSHAVGSATRTIMSIISRSGSNSVISDDEEDGL